MLTVDLLEYELSEDLFGHSRSKLLRALAARGWQATTVRDEYRNPEAPEFSIDLDLDGYAGSGPFVIFRGDRKIGRLSYVPYASHLTLKAATP